MILEIRRDAMASTFTFVVTVFDEESTGYRPPATLSEALSNLSNLAAELEKSHPVRLAGVHGLSVGRDR